MHPYWLKQTEEKPLFPDLLWSKPENKQFAGKLLIVGGNAHGFAAPAEAYNESLKAGIGASRVLLPDSLQKTIGKVFEAGEYAPSTPSGSFNQKSLSELLLMSNWADGLMLAGDFGRNSETAILLEQVIAKYSGPLILTQDGLDYFTKTPKQLIEREQTLLVTAFAQLQKIFMASHSTTALTFDMDWLRLVEALHNFTDKYPISIILKHHDNLFVAYNGKVSSTKLDTEMDVWRVKTAAHAAIWWLQNQTKVFESLTTSLIEISS